MKSKLISVNIMLITIILLLSVISGCTTYGKKSSIQNPVSDPSTANDNYRNNK